MTTRAEKIQVLNIALAEAKEVYGAGSQHLEYFNLIYVLALAEQQLLDDLHHRVVLEGFQP